MAGGADWLHLEIRPVKSLRPHEETIESSTRDMVTQLQKDRVQKDPMIVDNATGVVLDGMHRLSAFRKLGIPFAACSLVGYESPSISVGRWLRVYRLSGKKEMEEMLAAVGLTTEVRTSDATDLLNRREASAAGFANGSAFLQQESKDIVAGFSLLRSADVFAQSRKMDRSFVGEEELSNHAQGSSEIVLATGRLDKGDILNAGISGRLLPCKTSRHSVDPRPVAVNIPVDELRTGSKKTLERLLSERRFEELPPNSVYEGRKYKERLLLLGRR